MTEVICPFCGAPNPIEAEKCKVCDNPLTLTPSEDFNLAEGDQPEWLKELRDINPDKSSSESLDTGSGGNQGAKQSEEDVPEWLARVRQRTQEDREQDDSLQPEQGQSDSESDNAAPFFPEDMPSWLFSDDQSGEAGSSFSEPGGMDWMAVIDGEENQPSGELPPAGSKSGPDWDQFGIESESPEGEPALNVEHPHDTAEISHTPESAIQPEQTEKEASLPEAHSELESSPDQPESSGEKAFIIDDTDWHFEAETPDAEGDTSETSKPETPEFLEESTANFSDNHDEEPVEKIKKPRPSLRDELLKAPEEPQTSKPFPEPEIEQAQLPSWLEAMKPIESVAPATFAAEADHQIENSGPLAGFQGVLPGGNLENAYTRPPAYSLKLKVSDKQRVYASLLENLIADEAKAPPKEVVKPTVTGIYLRLVIAVALVGMLIFISLTGIQIGSLPNLFAPESVAFFDTTKQLTSSGTPTRILVAVEYEPGLSAELQSAAIYPIQQLLGAGANLALISTLPTGPALGQKLVSDAAADQTNINLDQQMIDLGYLPGGTASLASLAVQPSLAAPKTLSGQSVWESSILQGIQSIGDFNGMILLTDNPELARTWIEQVQTALSGKPFLVVSSAQSAPMILPYYDSGQIQGLLTGLTGGAVYDQLAQRANDNNSRYWNGYQAGLIVAILAILAGALFYGARGLFRARPSGKRS
jgi:hypothetical protein